MRDLRGVELLRSDCGGSAAGALSLEVEARVLRLLACGSSVVEDDGLRRFCAMIRDCDERSRSMMQLSDQRFHRHAIARSVMF